MVTLNLPKGNRRMDLVGRDAAGRWLFAEPAALRAPDPRLHTASQLSGLASAGVIVAGLCSGLPVAAEVSVLAVGVALGVFALFIGPRLARRDGPAIAVDPARAEVVLPEGMKISGALPMNLVALELAPDENETRNASKQWWVVLSAPASDAAHESLRIEVRLYGPGTRGDMDTARRQIALLGTWRTS